MWKSDSSNSIGACRSNNLKTNKDFGVRLSGSYDQGAFRL